MVITIWILSIVIVILTLFLIGIFSKNDTVVIEKFDPLNLNYSNPERNIIYYNKRGEAVSFDRIMSRNNFRKKITRNRKKINAH